jgi:putative ABC transport system permease protein
MEADLNDELETHRSMVQERLERGGLTAAAAAHASRRLLGNVTLAREDTHDVWRWRAVHGIGKDLRFGLRALRRTPVLTAIAVLTLALGIGANTAIFSIIRAVVLRPLPYADSDRLALLWSNDEKRGLPEQSISYRLFTDWRDQSRAFQSMGIFTPNPAVLIGGDAPERTLTAFVSSAVFSVLGVPAAVGRTLSLDDEAHAERVAVISHGLWQRRYGGRSDIVGQPLEIDGDANSYKKGPRTIRIVGVMPPDFYFPDTATQVWEPSTMYWRFANESQYRFEGPARRWGVVARLASGVRLVQARAEMATIGQRLEQAYPVTDHEFPGFGISVVPMLDHMVGRRLQLALWVLFAAVGCVLLIACGNVANMLLARGAARERELAIRAAIGAGRGRLARQLFIEGALLATAGGLAAGWLASFGVRAMTTSTLADLPRVDGLRVDGAVLGFTALVAALSALLFGLVPAWKLSRQDPNDALKEGGLASSTGRRVRRLGSALVVAQCSLAVVLLTGAGLMLRSFARVQAIDPGFNPDRVLLVRVGLAPGLRPARTAPGDTGAAMFATREDLFARMTERIAAIEGVRSVGAISDLMIRGAADDVVTIEGGRNDPDAREAAQLAAADVDPGFFTTMEVPLVRGRLFTRADALEKIRLFFPQSRGIVPPATSSSGPSAGEAVIVNQAFVRRYFPTDDPLDKRFYTGSLTGKHYWYRIVGVVGDVHREGPERQAIPQWYGQLIGSTTDVVVRTDREPRLLSASVAAAARSMDRHLMVLSITTVEDRLAAFTAPRQLQTMLLAIFAAAALLLASIGISGIVGYSVSQRTREIGVRMAFGADRGRVVRSVVVESMRLPLFGLALGIGLAAGATRLISHLLFDVTAFDPMTFAGVSTLLSIAALLACWLPARRAATVDPLIALREL